jgi:hypothetical protein
MSRTSTLLLLLFLAGCAGQPAPAATATTSLRASRTELAAAVLEEEPALARQMSVSGITGSLSALEVQRALEPRNEDFARCFLDRSARFHELSGQVRIFVRVAADGTVERAFPEDSTLGDRGVERCVAEVASATRFPRPRGGGAAELRWPLHIDPPSNVRNPITWDSQRVARVVEREGRGVVSRCMPDGGTGAVQVTAYVRGNRVVSVGAAVTDEALAGSMDCVADAVRRWRLPSTPRMAKVTFELRG